MASRCPKAAPSRMTRALAVSLSCVLWASLSGCDTHRKECENLVTQINRGVDAIEKLGAGVQSTEGKPQGQAFRNVSAEYDKLGAALSAQDIKTKTTAALRDRYVEMTKQQSKLGLDLAQAVEEEDEPSFYQLQGRRRVALEREQQAIATSLKDHCN